MKAPLQILSLGACSDAHRVNVVDVFRVGFQRVAA